MVLVKQSPISCLLLLQNIILIVIIIAQCCHCKQFQLGEEVKIECQTKSQRQLQKINWSRNNETIQDVDVEIITERNELTSTLLIKHVRSSHEGFYRCAGPNRKTLAKMTVRVEVATVKETTDSGSEDVFENKPLLLPISEAQKIVHVPSGGRSVIPCIKAFPYVQLFLNEVNVRDFEEDLDQMVYDPDEGIVILKGSLVHHSGIQSCRAEYNGREEMATFHLQFSFRPSAPGLQFPKIEAGDTMWTEGGVYSLECSVKVSHDKIDSTELFWRLPNPDRSDDLVQFTPREVSMKDGWTRMTTRLTLENVNLNDAGLYICEAEQFVGDAAEIQTAQVQVVVLEQGGVLWDLSGFNHNVTVSVNETVPVSVRWVIGLVTSPGARPEVHWLDPQGREIHTDLRKYSLLYNMETESRYQLVCNINDVGVADMGVYQLLIKREGEEVSSLNMRLSVRGPPIVTLRDKSNELLNAESLPEFACGVTSYPMEETEIEVKFLPCGQETGCLPFQNEPRSVANSNGTSEDTDLSMEYQSGTMSVAVNTFKTESTSDIRFQIEGGGGDLESGMLSCTACNGFKEQRACVTDTLALPLNDVAAPLVLHEERSRSKHVLTCTVSRLVYASITWYKVDNGNTSHLLGMGENEADVVVEETYSSFSLSSHLTFPNFSSPDSRLHDGVYQCRAMKMKTAEELFRLFMLDPELFPEERSFEVESEPLLAPFFPSPTFNGTSLQLKEGGNYTLNCLSAGNPLPSLQWFKDGQILAGETDNELQIINASRRKKKTENEEKKAESALDRFFYDPEQAEDDFIGDAGQYECEASNIEGDARIGVTLFFAHAHGRRVERTMRASVATISGITVICLLFVVIVIIFIVCYYKKKLKRTKSQIPKRDIEAFKLGDPKGLAAIDALRKEKLLEGEDNCVRVEAPGQSLAENSHMLPYDESYEFDRDQLVLGTQIGAGAFGRVYRAQARGILEPDLTDTVAVKTLKFQPELEHLKALMSELKMLIHIGRHPRLLALLGACTARLKERELFVILEYCPLGSLQDVLRKSRTNFLPTVKELSISTGGARLLSPGAYNSVQSNSNVFFRSNTLRSAHTPTLSHGKDNDMMSHYSSSSGGAPSPDHYLKMTSDVTPLTMGDLITWSLHVAEGMSYLGAKKVLHGDLASRNILIGEDGAAKISDFGLSRNIYHANTYKKNSPSALPVKWMAPESLREMVFSSYSDIWSYGIFLWEVFSLGATPYPGIQPGPKFIESLLRGERMERPEHAPPDIHQVMLMCWTRIPEERIPFARIENLLKRRLRDSSTFSSLEPMGMANNDAYMQGFEGEEPPLDSQGYLVSLQSPGGGAPSMPVFMPMPQQQIMQRRQMSQMSQMSSPQAQMSQMMQRRQMSQMSSPQPNTRQNSQMSQMSHTPSTPSPPLTALPGPPPLHQMSSQISSTEGYLTPTPIMQSFGWPSPAPRFQRNSAEGQGLEGGNLIALKTPTK